MEENPYEPPEPVETSVRQPITLRSVIALGCYLLGSLFMLWATVAALFGSRHDGNILADLVLGKSGASAACFALALYVGGKRWRLPVGLMLLPMLHILFQLIWRGII